MGKSGQCSGVVIPVDRISYLPDSLILYILSFLPTKHAIATRLLSRRWKLLWRGVTTLDFDDESEFSYKGEEKMNDLQEVAGLGEIRMSFVHFVNNVLLEVDPKCLEKFRLKWMKRCQPVYFPVWISYAIARSVRILDIEVCPRNQDIYPENTALIVYFHLPNSLFTCGTLELVKLQGHILVQVPSSVRLPKLEVLKLCSVYYESGESVQKLLSGCPALHSLKISTFVDDNLLDYKISSPSLKYLEVCNDYFPPPWDGIVEIDAPAVEFFVFRDPIWKGCSVKRLTSVNTAVLELFDDPEDEDYSGWGLYSDRCNSAVKLLEALNRVNHLTLKGNIMRSLSNATTPLSTIFERLTELDIDGWRWFPWSSLNVMLGRSVKLQVLNFTMFCFGPMGSDRGSWKDPEEVPECLSSSLERISLRGFRGLKDEIKMIKYILKHGAMLKLFHVGYSGIVQEELQRKISKFPRCCGTCRIEFALENFSGII